VTSATSRCSRALALAFVLGLAIADAEAAVHDVMVGFPARILLPGAIYDEPIDPAPICLPASFSRRVARRAASLVEAPVDPEAARHWVALHDRSLGHDVLVRFIAARAARTPREIHRSAIALEELRGDVDRELRECATLESARMLLFQRRYADAAARAIQAQAVARTPERRRIATFYRAEAHALSGRRETARELLLPIAESQGDEPIVAAARARIAALDLASDDETVDRPRARAALESAVLRAREIGLPIAAFGARAVEAALEADDDRGVEEWISALLRTRMPIEVLDWLRVLEADREAAKGHIVTARAKYDAIAHARAGSPIGTLAALRSLLHADLRRGDAELRWLRETAASATPPLSGYARLVLAQVAIASDEPEHALDLLTAAVFEHPRADLARATSARITELLSQLLEAGDEAECSRSLEIADWRRTLLVQSSARIEPFLALGRCYERFGLAAPAEGLYRDALRRFGAEAGPLLALPLARTSLALGEVARTRTVALAQSRVESPQQSAWQLLLGRAQIAEGDDAGGLATLAPLVERGEPQGERMLALSEFARVLRRRGELASQAAAISRALLALPAVERDERAALLAVEIAHAHRESGRASDARTLYDLALATSVAPSTRAEALYWRDARARDRARAPSLREIAGEPQTRPWAELARTTLDVFDLRARLREGMPSIAEYMREFGG